jgi:hypothetical protein
MLTDVGDETEDTECNIQSAQQILQVRAQQQLLPVGLKQK